jgi:single-strand DNA-binding protein
MSILSGVFRLGQDAEVRYLPNGDPVATLSLACNYGKKDPGTGFRKSQWYDAGLWGDRAESLAPHLKKGTTLFVVLEDVHIETYTNRDGATKAKLAARIVSLEFVGSRERDSQGEGQQARPAAAPQAPASRPAAPRPAAAGSGFDDMDDDIPF